MALSSNLVRSYSALSKLISALNTAIVLFPHIAILSLLGASGAWWAALAAGPILLYGARREMSKLQAVMVDAMFDSPVAPRLTPEPAEGAQKEEQKS